MNAIETAVGLIEAYAEKELALLREQSVKRESLAAAEQAAGNEYLESSTTGSIDSVLRARAEVDAVGRAIKSCRLRRMESIAAKIAAEAEALRQHAAVARGEAANIIAQAEPLLERIAAIQGVAYQAQGVTQSQGLLSRASSQERQADEILNRGVPKEGNLQIDDAITPEGIALQAVRHASEGPDAQSVIVWIAAQPRRELFSTHKISVRLNWSSGVIGGTSYIKAFEPLNPAPVAPAPPVPTGGNLISVDQFLGHAFKPRRDNREEQSA